MTQKSPAGAVLPTPATAPASAGDPPRASVTSTLGFIAVWIFFSSTVILFNKWILSPTGGRFPFPVFLTTWHMLFATLGTVVLRHTTSLLPSLDQVTITKTAYAKNVLPIGVVFAASLVLSNKAYLYLSVSFIQMLKAATPVVVLLLSFVFGVEKPSASLFVIILLVSGGVFLASVGEIQFVLTGFVYQAVGVVVESTRLVLVQLLLTGNGLKFDPLSALYLFAPVCFVTNTVVFITVELPTFSMEALYSLGFLALFLNALAAFCLNISVVYLLKNSSPVVFSLSGVVKDILLIALSTLLFSTSVTPLQVFGYSSALCGIVAFNRIKQVGKVDFPRSGVAGMALILSLLGGYAALVDPILKSS